MKIKIKFLCENITISAENAYSIEVEANVDKKQILDHFDSDDCIEYVGEDSFLEIISLDNIIEHHGIGAILNHIDLDDIKEYLKKNGI